MPANHGAAPVIPAGSAAPQITDLRYSFTIAEKLFTEYDSTDKYLRQQLLLPFDKKCVRSLQHKYIGYGNTTTREMLDHLYSTYANISPSELQYNNARLCTPYNSNHTIDNLTDQIENPG